MAYERRNLDAYLLSSTNYKHLNSIVKPRFKVLNYSVLIDFLFSNDYSDVMNNKKSCYKHVNIKTRAKEILKKVRNRHTRTGRVMAIVMAIVLVPLSVYLIQNGSTHENSSAASISNNQKIAQLKVSAAKTTNNSLKFLHTTWWNANYSTNPTNYDTIVMPKTGKFSTSVTTEVTIRSQAMAAYATALALGGKYYDPQITTVPEATARLHTVGWINGMANHYKVSNSWGHNEFAALLLDYTALAAKQVWDSLPAVTKDILNGAVRDEANYWSTRAPLYYMDNTGKILYPGDTQSETVGMVGNLLLMASRAYSDVADTETVSKWENQARLYQLASYASPSQVGTDPRINGSNINNDGTVTNHNHLAVDYTFAYGEFMQTNQVIANQSKTLLPEEALNNFNLIWNAATKTNFTYPTYNGLATYPFGGTILRKDNAGNSIAAIYYPQGPDTGTAMAGSEYKFKPIGMAIEAFLKNGDETGYGWAKAFQQYVLNQQSRHSNGRVFAAEELTSVEYESFVAMLMAEQAYWLTSIQPSVVALPPSPTPIPTKLSAGVAPIVTLTSPNNTAVYTNASVFPTLKARGNSQTDRLKLAFRIKKVGSNTCYTSWNSNNKSIWNYSIATGDETSYTFTKTYSAGLFPLTAGIYSWSAKAIDDKPLQSVGGTMCDGGGWAPERTFTIAPTTIPTTLPAGTPPIVILTAPANAAVFYKSRITTLPTLGAKAYSQANSTKRLKLVYRIKKIGFNTCYTSWNSAMGYAWSYSQASGTPFSYIFSKTFAAGMYPLTVGTYTWSAKALDDNGVYSQNGGKLFCDSDGWAPERTFTIR